MAEMRVTIQDGVTGLDYGVPTAAGVPNSLSVSNGQIDPFTTLNAVTGNATGLTMDCGSSHEVVTIVGVGTGTLAGTLTIEGSLDNVTWVSTSITVGLTAAATVTTTSSFRAFRYYRVSLSGASGTGSVTVKMMANG